MQNTADLPFYKKLDSMLFRKVGNQDLPITFWQKRIWLAIQLHGRVILHGWEAGRSIRIPQPSWPEAAARQIIVDELSPRRIFVASKPGITLSSRLDVNPNNMKGDR